MARKKFQSKGLLDHFYSVVRNDYVECNDRLHHSGQSLICYCWDSANAHLIERALTKYGYKPTFADFVTYDVLDPPIRRLYDEDDLPF